MRRTCHKGCVMNNTYNTRLTRPRSTMSFSLNLTSKCSVLLWYSPNLVAAEVSQAHTALPEHVVIEASGYVYTIGAVRQTRDDSGARCYAWGESFVLPWADTVAVSIYRKNLIFNVELIDRSVHRVNQLRENEKCDRICHYPYDQTSDGLLGTLLACSNICSPHWCRRVYIFPISKIASTMWRTSSLFSANSRKLPSLTSAPSPILGQRARLSSGGHNSPHREPGYTTISPSSSLDRARDRASQWASNGDDPSTRRKPDSTGTSDSHHPLPNDRILAPSLSQHRRKQHYGRV
ncbi:hypothetical protein C8R44DRAFT_364207 [Mycena epipterygia]|nr:hypothetical protein C8R44DRAFT_364207 [Mycena epipterygia]